MAQGEGRGFCCGSWPSPPSRHLPSFTGGRQQLKGGHLCLSLLCGKRSYCSTYQNALHIPYKYTDQPTQRYPGPTSGSSERSHERRESLTATEVDLPESPFVNEPVSRLINTILGAALGHHRVTPKSWLALTAPWVCGRPGTLGSVCQCNRFVFFQRGGTGSGWDRAASSRRLWGRLEATAPHP